MARKNSEIPRESGCFTITLRRAAGPTFGWTATPAQKVGAYRVNYVDGSMEEIPLVQGRNIADPTYPLLLTAACTAWEGKMAEGTPVRVYAYEWKNPHAEREISSIDFISAGTHASPTLLGLSIAGP
jgi:hypothetical protein